MHLALAISVVLMAMLLGSLAYRYPTIRKKVSSISTVLLATILLLVASLSAFYITFRLPVVGAIAVLGTMLLATKFGQRAISNKVSILSRGTNAIHVVTKAAFVLVVGTFVLSRVFVALAQYVKGG